MFERMPQGVPGDPPKQHAFLNSFRHCAIMAYAFPPSRLLIGPPGSMSSCGQKWPKMRNRWTQTQCPYLQKYLDCIARPHKNLSFSAFAFLRFRRDLIAHKTPMCVIRRYPQLNDHLLHFYNFLQNLWWAVVAK